MTAREPIDAAQRFFRRLEGSSAMPRDLSPVDAASAVLCAISLRLSSTEASEFIQSLPTTLRALFTVCVRHRREQPVSLDLPAFVDMVAEHLRISELDARRLAQAVIAAIQDEMPSAQVTAVAERLPPDLRMLWSSAPKVA